MLKASSSNPQIVNLYATPIMLQQLEGMEQTNAALKKLLLAKRDNDTRDKTAKQKSNYSGWRSTEDLWQWPEPCVGQLKERVFQSFKTFISDAGSLPADTHYQYASAAWANIHRAGGYNVVHQHAGFQWAGVYYVAAQLVHNQGADPDENPYSGVLTLEDPRPGAAMTPLQGFNAGLSTNIEATTGMLVMFPAWLRHFVHPYQGLEPRISIAFNIRLEFL